MKEQAVAWRVAARHFKKSKKSVEYYMERTPFPPFTILRLCVCDEAAG
jgi:hypothetical protein